MPADTIAIVLDETVIALTEGFNILLENLYAYDAEHFFVMRVPSPKASRSAATLLGAEVLQALEEAVEDRKS